MKQIFTDAADILNTTIKAQELDRTAHDLGRGDAENLENAGLQAKSNAATSTISETRRRKEKNKALLTALELALQNAEYRQHYQAVWQKIDDTQSALDEAILENAEHIEALEDNALRTADGRMIFKTDNGFVYADGMAVAKQDEPSPSDILDNATQWADYKDATDRREVLARIQTDTLDPIQKRMSDPDNPPDKSTLDDFDKQLEDADKVIHQVEAVTPPVESPSIQADNLNLDIFIPS